MIDFFTIFEFIGTIAFSISGATTAIKRQMDLLGVVVLGMVTAVGGGMLRDVMLSITPTIFSDPFILFTAFFSSIFIFLLLYMNIKLTETKPFNAIFLLSDSIGLAVFTIFGCKRVLSLYDPGIAIFFGVLTGVGGGIIRDILAGQTPYVLSKHFYASSCIIGAIVYVVLNPYEEHIAVFLGILVIFILRMMAAHFRWNLPKVPMQ
ncbi:MAG: trimeric intracellular cation channel family protein [Lachnospiraceae bacterium]|nr:trimeric intracellular cation channel family protein [Lachnospiraceae bacterium]